MIIELDLHPHSTQGLDQLRLVGQHEAGASRVEDDLRGRIDHLVADPAVEHSNDAPHARSPFGARPRRLAMLVEAQVSSMNTSRSGSSSG